MSLRVEIAGVGIALCGPGPVLEPMRGKLAPFLVRAPNADDVQLEIGAVHDEYEPDLRLDRAADLSVEAALGEGGVVMRGAVGGRYDPASRRGWLDAPRNLGEVDALIRLALSLELPRRRAILLHASAVTRGLVFAGASGAGKSTAAAALGPALSDELVVVRDLDVYGTPYWNGRAEKARIDRIVILERGEQSCTELAGTRALAALSPHVVRYVADEAVDREVLAVCAELCQRARLVRVRCPEGDAFLPALRAILEL